MPRHPLSRPAPPPGPDPTAETPQPDAVALALQLLGGARWQRWRAHRPEGPALPLNWRDAALLAILALDGAQPRDRLVELLWPIAPTLQVGRLSLRQRVHRLRQATGHDLVQADQALQLCQAGLDCDLWPLRWERRGHWPEGELLEGVEGLPATHEALAEWLQQARQRVAQSWQDSLERACRQAEQARDHARTARLCRQWLRRCPWSEAQWRRLVEALYLSGDLQQAADAVTQMHRVIADDLGLTPTEPTRVLVDTVERALRDRQRVIGIGCETSLPACHIDSDPGRGRRGWLEPPQSRGSERVPSATQLEAQLRALGPTALLLARALALIEQVSPQADRVPTAARILQTPALGLITPWRELEDVGIAVDGALTNAVLREALLDGIPTPLRHHLQAELRAGTTEGGRPTPDNAQG